MKWGQNRGSASRRVVLGLVPVGFLEVLDAFAETSANLREPARSEKQQDDDEDDDELGNPDVAKHVCS